MKIPLVLIMKIVLLGCLRFMVWFILKWKRLNNFSKQLNSLMCLSTLFSISFIVLVVETLEEA